MAPACPDIFFASLYNINCQRLEIDALELAFRINRCDCSFASEGCVSFGNSNKVDTFSINVADERIDKGQALFGLARNRKRGSYRGAN